MGRSGISYDKKIEDVEKYKRGEGSQSSIAREFGVNKGILALIANSITIN